MPRPIGTSKESGDYGTLTVRIPRELLDQIEAIAQREERSLNYVAARLLREALEPPKRKGSGPADD